MSRCSRPRWPSMAGACAGRSSRRTNSATKTRPTSAPRSREVSTNISGSSRRTSGRPLERRGGAHDASTLPYHGASDHGVLGGAQRHGRALTIGALRLSMRVPDDAWQRAQRTGEDRERGKPMTTIIDPVETGVIAPAALATSATVTTTLYDLIATIQDVVGPGNDRLVVATVVHMLAAGSLILPSALDMLSSTVLSSVGDC